MPNLIEVFLERLFDDPDLDNKLWQDYVREIRDHAQKYPNFKDVRFFLDSHFGTRGFHGAMLYTAPTSTWALWRQQFWHDRGSLHPWSLEGKLGHTRGVSWTATIEAVQETVIDRHSPGFLVSFDQDPQQKVVIVCSWNGYCVFKVAAFSAFPQGFFGTRDAISLLADLRGWNAIGRQIKLDLDWDELNLRGYEYSQGWRVSRLQPVDAP